MRRTLLATVLALAVGMPASAAPAVTVTDAAGDWAVASQDILRVRVTSGPSGTARTVRAALTLAAAPDPSTTYTVLLAAGTCGKDWQLRVRNIGTPAQAATVEQFPCDVAGTFTPTTAPASVSVKGSTVEITAPYVLGMAKGTTLTYVNAFAATYFTGVGFFGGGVDKMVFSGDYAFGDVRYQLG